MVRLILFFAAIVLAALGFSWLAELQGTIKFENIGGSEGQPGTTFELNTVKVVVLLLTLVAGLILAWTVLKGFFTAPGNIVRSVRTRRESKGITALNEGIIAVNAGDSKMAAKLAKKADKALVHRPMSALLKAQAAHLAGNPAAARRIYESMLKSPDTEVMGLRGLYNEARKENELIAAKQFAEKAIGINKNLGWAIEGLLELQSRSGEWHAARQTLKLARMNAIMDKPKVNRLRAVLLSAEAMELEVHDADQALKYALESHKLAKDLVLAAEVAGRILASKGKAGRAAKIVARTWELIPHPDLAVIYAHSQTGDSFRDRITRLETLSKKTPDSPEGSIAIAEVALEAKDWTLARKVLEPYLPEEPSERICTLMARIEGGEYGDKGRVREWLARAVNAPGDPAWIADGFISDHWLPVSPVSGELDRFKWSVPPQSPNSQNRLSHEEFIAITASQLKGSKDTSPKAEKISASPTKGKDGKKQVSDAVVVEESKTKTQTQSPLAKPKLKQDKSHPTSTADSKTGSNTPAKTITVAAKSKENSKQKFVSSERAPDDPGTGKDINY